MKRELIILDFETNGFAGTSVLSISAIKALVSDNEIVEIDRYNRYYHLTPGEIENPHAIAINNLSKSNLEVLRKDIDYPTFYIDDVQSFLDFCQDADHFIAHNFSFDREFICFETAISFCTFLESRKMNIGKYNKLSDFAAYYNIEIDPSNLHNSMYDVEVLFEIIQSMYEEKNSNFLIFLEERPLNKKEQKSIQTRFNSYLISKTALREKTLKNRIIIESKKETYDIIIKNLVLPEYDLSITQFLNIANTALLNIGLKKISSVIFNNFLKQKNILKNNNGTTTLSELSQGKGVFSILKKGNDDSTYEMILYNSLGKKTLKEELVLFINSL